MARKKLIRYQQNNETFNVLEAGKSLMEGIKGHWNERIFQNNNPIVLELGCGRGEYSVGLGRAYPHKNFIGIDIKGDRIAVGSQQALTEKLYNIAFLRTQIQQLDQFFAIDEVSEIWITFPDPRLRNSDAKRRLTSPRFLEMYRKLLKNKGLLHLKTDCEPFFDYSLSTLQQYPFTDFLVTKDLYHSDLNNLHLGIKTKYEGIFTEKGFSINYLQCTNKKEQV